MVTEIRYFYSLKELSENVEDELDSCRRREEEYGERLGALLRDNEANHGDEEWFKELSGLQKAPSDSKGKGKGKGKKKGAKSGWIQFKDLMLSKEEYGEAQILFEAIEEIKSKAGRLEKVLEQIEDLRKLGLGENILYITFLREGVPEKIVLSKKNGDEFGKKFEYIANFSITQAVE